MGASQADLRIVLVQPPSPPFMDVDREFRAGLGLATKTDRARWGQTTPTFYNHALAWTCGVLESKGIDVRFVDAQADDLDEDRLTSRIVRDEPTALIWQVNLPSLAEDLALLDRVRRAVPGATTVVVGTVVALFPERVSSASGVDFAVTGEPERVVPELLETLDTGGDGPVRGVAVASCGRVDATPRPFAASIDDVAKTPYHLMPMHAYRGKYFAPGEAMALIVTSKGCPYACGRYCPYPSAFGRRVRFRSPLSVVDEMELLVSAYGIRHFIFRDQNFTIDREHAEEICAEVIRRRLDISWVCETRLQLVDPALLGLMRAAGCEQINYGLETGDPRTFENVAKPGARFDAIAPAVAATRAVGIKAHGHLLLGLPDDSWFTVLRTVRLVRAAGFDSINASLLNPVPGTAFHAEAAAAGLLDDVAPVDAARAVLPTRHMGLTQLQLAVRLVNDAFSDAGGLSAGAARANRFMRSRMVPPTARTSAMLQRDGERA